MRWTQGPVEKHQTNVHIIGDPEEENSNEAQKLFKDIMAKILQNLVKFSDPKSSLNYKQNKFKES